jgi:site-specific DNA-methyltransferase (adenine-specific)
MPNKSHFNSGLRALNQMSRDGKKHSSYIEKTNLGKNSHFFLIDDSIDFLSKVPDNSVQLILIDPPYNLELDTWDVFDNYLEWAKQWIDQIHRVLKPEGNCVIFGGFQYQDLKKGDLLEILHYTRHKTKLRFTNLIIWYYKNGMSAHRYFANRHEEVVWLTKTKKYYFDLDSVRAPYDEISKAAALKDKRLIPANIEKGKNPTNVWEISRLNGNSKERVGHPTQKPLEIIRRFVKSLSFPGSIVLDFFAGSGTTGRICIEEGRNSILVDNDLKSIEYFEQHLNNMGFDHLINDNKIIKNANREQVLSFLTEQTGLS